MYQLCKNKKGNTEKWIIYQKYTNSTLSYFFKWH